MQKIVLVGGEAGQGIARTAFLAGKAFIKLGYYVFGYREYPSLITGGHNFNILKVSDAPVYSHENFFDAVIALNQRTVDEHENDLAENGFVLGDESLKARRLVGVDTQEILEKLDAPKIVCNNVLLGALFKAFGLPVEPLLEVVGKRLKKFVEVNEDAVKEGYAAVKEAVQQMPPAPVALGVEKKLGKRFFINGNEAVASGAIASGLDVYVAYPITPVTPALHFLASKQSEHSFVVFQPENEIAVANVALGASYAGATVMVGTAGPGFALMSEAISLQGMAEVPLVVYFGQRTGPSTGVPTHTSQGDLEFAVNAGHGEFPRVVVAPGDAREAFYRTIEAFYLAYKYRVLSIILGDKHLSESSYCFDESEFEAPLVAPSKFIVSLPSRDYKSYALSEAGVSPRAVPGQGAVVRANSYEHDEFGHSTEDPKWIVAMNNKRLAKIEAVKKEVSKLKPVSVYGKGRNLLISWGSTKGAILDALPSLKDLKGGFRFMQVSYMSPFPAEEVKKEIREASDVVLVENNATGLLGRLVREQAREAIDGKVLKYDGRPFTPAEVVSAVKKKTMQ